jgi:hypothetical protein
VNGGVTVLACVNTGDYASGTNNRASGGGGALVKIPPGHVGPVITYWDQYECQSLTLSIGGQVVKTWVRDPTRPPTVPDSQNVVWDSTHFSSASTTIVAKVKYLLKRTSTGETAIQEVTHTKTMPIKNKAALFGRNEWENGSFPDGNGAGTSQTKLPGLNIVPMSPVTFMGWTSFNFYQTIQNDGPSVVYVNTHGNPAKTVANPPVSPPHLTWLQSDLDEVDPTYSLMPLTQYLIIGAQYQELAPGDSIYSRRVLANGSGLPFKNSTGHPPIWFAWNDACWTGNDNAFAEGYLYPYYTQGGAWCENQSQMGWSIASPIAMAKPGAETVWDHFQTGYTADESRLQLYIRYRQWCCDNGEPVPPVGSTAARATIRLFGDFYTRLHGVYTGTDADSPMGAWYR